MQIQELLQSIPNDSSQLDLERTLNLILPHKDSAYSLDQLENSLYSVRDQVEETQRQNNDKFDSILDESTQRQLQNLYKSLNDIQLNVMKLQCDIAFTKEQCETFETICNNPLIQERREMIAQENAMRKSLQQNKFDKVKEFFIRLADTLRVTVTNCQKSCSLQTLHHNQSFDWTQYHNAIFLLKISGKALIDVSRFERLYQSNVDIVNLVFKQSIDHIDFNNFIDFRNTYSLESLLEITTAAHRRQDLKEFMSDANINSIMNNDDPINYVVFEAANSSLSLIIVDCCRLLVDLNSNYIEAHLTDGIDIDKLNNSENEPSSDGQAAPFYAFAPQEYITQIGQHLLTLRKQTEQFDNNESDSLRYALSFLGQAHGDAIDVKACKSVTEIILKCIARHCIRSLLGRTNKSVLSRLTANGRRQLATDALYLDNVLDDLGLLTSDEPNVDKFKSLLIH